MEADDRTLLWLDLMGLSLVVIVLALLTVALAALDAEEAHVASVRGGDEEGGEVAPLLGSRRAWSQRALLEPIEE